MRVVHVAPSYCRRDGGPSEVLRGLLPQLEAKGLDVALVTTDKGLSETERADPPVRATVVRPHRGPYSLSYARGLRRAVRTAVEGADVVHVHGVDNYASVVGMREAARAGVPFVLQPHGAWNAYHRAQGRAKKWLWGRIWQDRAVTRAAAVIVSSSIEQRDARAVVGPGHVLVTAPLGVDEELFAIDTPWDERDGLLFLGRVAQKKRLDTVLLALQVARESRGLRSTLTVAGPVDTDLGYDPGALVGMHGLTGAVRFVGHVGREDRRRLLASHRCFVLMSDDESFGMAAAEAAAAGLAVVASPGVGAIADAQADGVGHVVEGDADQLAVALGAATVDAAPGSVAALREYARAHWTWDASSSRVLDAYLGAVS
ncbi:glycosyltransferase [Demequina activiva]|uniref:D-inositol 3-phosphate glycosyltransferase n=1 Tax=Demequina activiva TaxID=1582364 RepID=A0A919Q3J6_9MICO|nr:glycosyltransferase [Demequina activiva]GIG53783.1 glycosyl transferase family 1 [Demequina activiva]